MKISSLCSGLRMIKKYLLPLQPATQGNVISMLNLLS